MSAAKTKGHSIAADGGEKLSAEKGKEPPAFDHICC
jgi:hypothetical protein